jgi:hypothetical protein
MKEDSRGIFTAAARASEAVGYLKFGRQRELHSPVRLVTDGEPQELPARDIRDLAAG